MNRRTGGGAVPLKEYFKEVIDRLDAQSREREANFNKWVERIDEEKRESEARLERERLAAEERQNAAEARLEREREASEARLEREIREFKSHKRWLIANFVAVSIVLLTMLFNGYLPF